MAASPSLSGSPFDSGKMRLKSIFVSARRSTSTSTTTSIGENMRAERSSALRGPSAAVRPRASMTMTNGHALPAG